jgi:hypothetical protein
MVVAAKDENSMKLLVPGYWEKSTRDSRVRESVNRKPTN